MSIGDNRALNAIIEDFITSFPRLMPPANSPVESTTPRVEIPEAQTSPQSFFLPHFRPLSSPTPELEPTLTFSGQAEDDVDAENVAFLRTTLEPSDMMSAEELTRELRPQRRRRETQHRSRSVSEELRERHIHGNRLDQVRQRHDISAEPSSDRSITRTRSPYGHGIPNHQSLFDWAPAGHSDAQGMDGVMAELTRQQPNTHPEILRVLARARLDSNREALNRAASRRPIQNGQTHEPSLRSAAILQSFRRNHRIVARSRDFMSRLATSERDRNLDFESTNTAPTRDSPYPDSQRWNDSTSNHTPGHHYELGRLSWQGQHRYSENRPTRAESLEALRRRYLQEPPSKMSEFERIIKYLHGSRSPDRDDVASFQPVANLQSSEKWTPWHCGSRLYKPTECRLTPTSWLTPGALFTGTQQANPTNMSSAATMHRLVNNQSHSHQPSEPMASRDYVPSGASAPHWLGHISTPELHSLYSSPSSTSQHHTAHDRWTVEVSIYEIDYTSMTLKGTMKAFNVPSLDSNPATNNSTRSLPWSSSSNAINASTNETPFCTYLEGELIDLVNHTLLTESDVLGVKTTPDNDALYWRRLEPFAKLTDDEIARGLLDRQWIEEELMGRYVLMRWKERCFIKPSVTSLTSQTQQPSTSSPLQAFRSQQSRAPNSDPQTFSQDQNSTTSFLSAADGSGYGLSISGFYYVSLRRSDGRLEGLYYDPQSSPYQHLEMSPKGGGWGRGTWEFR